MSLDPTTRTPLPFRSVRTSAFAIAAVASLLVGGCSTGGDDAATTTTEAEAGSSTTTEAATSTTDGADGSTTTTEGGGGGEVDVSDLDALMPDAADIGPDYEMTADVEEEDEPSPTDDALSAQCPGAAEFMSDDESVPGEAAFRRFEADDDREIEVKVDPTPSANFDEGRFEEVIDAINSCGTLEVESDGFNMVIELSATADDTYGDRGVTMSMTAVMTHPELLEPLELEFSAHAFVLGSVSVSLTASDGVDGQSAEEVRVVPGDHDLLDSIAAQLEPEIEALQG